MPRDPAGAPKIVRLSSVYVRRHRHVGSPPFPDVIDATFFEPNWIFKGRDAALEQELIRRFKKAM